MNPLPPDSAWIRALRGRQGSHHWTPPPRHDVIATPAGPLRVTWTIEEKVATCLTPNRSPFVPHCPWKQAISGDGQGSEGTQGGEREGDGARR
jgi:hypothetical protein